MIVKVQLKATGLFSIHDSFVLPSSHPISEAENSYLFVGVDSWHFPSSSFSYLTLQVDLMTCCYQNFYHLLPSPWLQHPPLHFTAALAHVHFQKPVWLIKPPPPFLLFIFSHFIGFNQLTEVGQAAETAQSSFLGRERIPNFHQQWAGNVAHCSSKKHREPAEQPGNTGNLPHVHSLNQPSWAPAKGSGIHPRWLCTKRITPSVSPAHLLRQHPPKAKWQELHTATSTAAAIGQVQPCRLQSCCWGMQRKPTGTRFSK